MSYDKLREMACEMADRLRDPNAAPGPMRGETATMIASLVALIDAYGPMVNMVNDAEEKALQACIHVIEGQTRFQLDEKVGTVLPRDDGPLIRRDDLLAELLRLNGYVEVEEIVAQAPAGA